MSRQRTPRAIGIGRPTEVQMAAGDDIAKSTSAWVAALAAVFSLVSGVVAWTQRGIAEDAALRLQQAQTALSQAQADVARLQEQRLTTGAERDYDFKVIELLDKAAQLPVADANRHLRMTLALAVVNVHGTPGQQSAGLRRAP
jgi:hypothetical protein